eukprot:gene9157-7791_t
MKVLFKWNLPCKATKEILWQAMEFVIQSPQVNHVIFRKYIRRLWNYDGKGTSIYQNCINNSGRATATRRSTGA